MPIPTNSLRLYCHRLMQGKLIQIIDFMSIIVMASLFSAKYYLMPDNSNLAINIILYILALEMNIYCIIRLLGMGLFYFQKSWCCFEFCVALILDLGFLLDITAVTPIIFAIGGAFRLVVLGQLFYLSKNRSILAVFNSLIFMIRNLPGIIAILLIVLVIFTTIGVSLFWNVKIQGNLTGLVNFESFDYALLTLFYCATGEGWGIIMYNLANVEGNCVSNVQSYADFKANGINGCGTSLAYPFFIIFIIFVYLISIKLFAVAALESFGEATHESFSIITSQQFEQFLEKWSDFDPQGTGWISIEELIYLMFELDPPLGVYDQKLRNALWKSYFESSKGNSPVIMRSKLVRRMISQIDINEEYLMHKYDNSVFERKKILILLKELNIPLEVGSWRVHFRDVCQRMTVRAIMNKFKEVFEYN